MHAIGNVVCQELVIHSFLQVTHVGYALYVNNIYSPYSKL